MKPLSRLLTLLILATLSTASTYASTVLYTNGPILGTAGAWNFSAGSGTFAADSFTLSGAATISSIEAGVWVIGAAPTTVDWEISTGDPASLGGTVVSSGNATWSNVYWGNVTLGGSSHFDIYDSTISGLNVSLGAGDYWLEFLHGQAVTLNQFNVLWDINFGPSQATWNGSVDAPSNSFTIYGSTATPEPGTLIMFGSGIIGLAGVLRRKINL